MRAFLETEDLADLVRRALGPGAGVAGVERLRGGTKKGVYRVRVTAHPDPSGAPAPARSPGPASVIVYRWAAGENFWPGGAEGGREDRRRHHRGRRGRR